MPRVLRDKHNSNRDMLEPWQDQCTPGALPQEYSASQVAEEIASSTAKCAVLERENAELRTALRKSINDSVFGKEFEAISVDREHMTVLIEQLKMEKSHLVESVLSLSGEVDDANRARQEDQTKFKQEVLRHGENEKALRASKYRMGMQVVELLKIRGVNNAVCQELNSHIANACVTPTLPSLLATSFSSSLSAAAASSSSFSSGMLDPHAPSTENKSGEAGETDGRFHMHTQSNDRGGGSNSSSRDTDDAPAGNTRRRQKNHRMSSKSPGRRRRSEVLSRDETESIISSVSTHRSGASTSAAMSKSSSMHHSRHSKAHSTPITAESLALLDKQNNEGGRNVSRATAPPPAEVAPRNTNWWGF